MRQAELIPEAGLACCGSKNTGFGRVSILSPGDSTYCFAALSLSLVAFCCCSVTSNSLCPVGLQHAKLPYPSLFPRACSNSCPLNGWCHPIISSSVTPFSSCPQSFPTSESFPVSWLFAPGGQSIGASASASVLLVNIQDWFLQDWLVWSPCSPRDSQESSPTPQFKSISSSVLRFLYSLTLTSIQEKSREGLVYLLHPCSPVPSMDSPQPPSPSL